LEINVDSERQGRIILDGINPAELEYKDILYILGLESTVWMMEATGWDHQISLEEHKVFQLQVSHSTEHTSHP